MKVWFTADNHFGHANIIKFCKRPFSNAQEMDREMIRRWNERVAPEDTVRHLGDFSFQNQGNYIHALNGAKHLIVGNHDHKRMQKVGWASIKDMDLITVDSTDIVLCHYGLRVWHKSHYGALHFYGHSHGTLPGDSQSLDVGVDCWDFRPVSLDEIKQRLATLPKRGDPHAKAFPEALGLK